MSTKTRNLSNIQGVNVPAPDSTGFTSNKIESFPSDAAYESAILPALPTVGDIYFNTTENCLREHNGTSWQYDKIILSFQVDSTKTGAAQTITPNLTDQAIRFTSGTLASIKGITAPGNQKTLYLTNDQALQSITVQNQAAGETAANRIITGLNTDMVIQPGRTATLIYDEDVSRWRVTSAQAIPSGGIEVFANDAAYEASHPSPGVGAVYWNSTISSLREYNGTAWQHDKLQVDTQTDAVKTGANQDITPASNQIIRFTSGTLTSIRGIIPTSQTFLFLVNDQVSQAISIQNQAAGATAANRIITGTGADFSLAAGKIVGLSYDSAASRWRISGGGAGGGLQPLLVSAALTAVAGTHYLTDTTALAFAIALPPGTTGATLRFTDATETWGLNNLTLTPATGEKIDQLAINEALVCDVIRGWVELNWTGTYWAFNSLASTQVGEASATSPGILTTGAQSIAGPKTFNDGLKVDDAVGQSVLNYYQELNHVTTWKGNNGGVASGSSAVKVTRVGRVVTLDFDTGPVGGVVPTTNSTNLESITPLPTWARPDAIKQIGMIPFSAGYDTVYSGMFAIDSTGIMRFFFKINQSTIWPNSVASAWYYTQITYTV